jgi:outer membrane protein assembly factor BamA
MSLLFRSEGILLATFLLNVSLNLHGQSEDCQEQDLIDVVRNKTKKMEPEVIIIKHPSIILIPVLGSSPATGFQFGAAGQAAWFMGTPETTRISQSSANFTYTLKNQFLMTLKSNVMSKNDHWIFIGDWRYYFYSQSTYGLGTNSGGSSTGFNIEGYDVSTQAGEEPMEFNWLRFHETVYKKIKKYFYLGVGYHLDDYSNINDKNLNVSDGKLTHHYLYSVAHGFNPHQYALSGVSANVVYDSRDNQINPYKGIYANLQYRYNPSFLGSAKTSSLTYAELRGYKGLSVKHPRHLIAGWIYANFVSSGVVPYLDLPAANYDTRNRASRGYVQGRFRGENIVYAETEYRFPISPCTGVLGGVLFVNAITASDKATGVHVFDYIKPGYGFGLRVKADKLSRTNISVDVGFGEHSSGIYFGAVEVF